MGRVGAEAGGDGAKLWGAQVRTAEASPSTRTHDSAYSSCREGCHQVSPHRRAGPPDHRGAGAAESQPCVGLQRGDHHRWCPPPGQNPPKGRPRRIQQTAGVARVKSFAYRLEVSRGSPFGQQIRQPSFVLLAETEVDRKDAAQRASASCRSIKALSRSKSTRGGTHRSGQRRPCVLGDRQVPRVVWARR